MDLPGRGPLCWEADQTQEAVLEINVEVVGDKVIKVPSAERMSRQDFSNNCKCCFCPLFLFCLCVQVAGAGR